MNQYETIYPVHLLALSIIAIMKFTLYLSALTALLTTITAQKLSGSAQGFAQGVTGGGSAAVVTPKNIQELVTYLTDKTPRVIVLDRTYDFIDSEGTVKEKGCAPWKTGAGCQLAINAAGNWCGDNPKVDVTYSKAGTSGINVASDKTIIGVGNKGIIKGKGLRFVNVKNIIVQNIRTLITYFLYEFSNRLADITNLNPQYVWGGDAFTFSGTSKIWIDHCTVSSSRQVTRTITKISRHLYLVASTTSLAAIRALASPSPTITSTAVHSGPLAATATTTGPSRWSARAIKSPSRVHLPHHHN